MVGKVDIDSTFPIILTVCRRSPQTPGTNVYICLRRGEVSQTDRRPFQIICKPGFTHAQNGPTGHRRVGAREK